MIRRLWQSYRLRERTARMMLLFAFLAMPLIYGLVIVSQFYSGGWFGQFAYPVIIIFITMFLGWQVRTMWIRTGDPIYGKVVYYARCAECRKTSEYYPSAMAANNEHQRHIAEQHSA